MKEKKSITVEQLYIYAREHNMEHAKLQFYDGCCYNDVTDVNINSSILYPDQQSIILTQ